MFSSCDQEKKKKSVFTHQLFYILVFFCSHKKKSTICLSQESKPLLKPDLLIPGLLHLLLPTGAVAEEVPRPSSLLIHPAAP